MPAGTRQSSSYSSRATRVKEGELGTVSKEVGGVYQIVPTLNQIVSTLPVALELYSRRAPVLVAFLSETIKT